MKWEDNPESFIQSLKKGTEILRNKSNRLVNLPIILTPEQFVNFKKLFNGLIEEVKGKSNS